MVKPPEKPDGDRDRLSLTAHNITLETPVEGEMVVFERDMDEGEIPPETFTEIVQNERDAVIRELWDRWMELLFNHRYFPIKLLQTKTTDINGVEAHVAQTETHGRFDRSVFKRHPRFENHMHDTGLTVCLEYALKSNKPPHEVVKNIPFQLFPSEIYRVREFVEKHGDVWITYDNRNWWERGPITTEYGMRGVTYFMYTINDGRIVPRYIGISRQHGVDSDELNWNFANSTSDSVYIRWGYGKGQHLGELSCAMWSDEYSWIPKPKYERWIDELFVNQSRLLRQPVYIEVLPWVEDNLLWAEENLVRAASILFRDELLNSEFTADHMAREQTTSEVRQYNL